MAEWRVARITDGVELPAWQVAELTGSAELASASTSTWQIAKLSGTQANTFAWRVAKLSGAQTKLVPSWKVAMLQARTIKATDGYMWAYVSGDWRPAFMHVYLNGGWVSLEPDEV